MPKSLYGLLGGLAMFAGLACRGDAPQLPAESGEQNGQTNVAAAADGDAPKSRLELVGPRYEGEVKDVNADGSVRVALGPDSSLPGMKPETGLLLAIVQRGPAPTSPERLVWATAPQPPTSGMLTLRVLPAAAKELKGSERVTLYRAEGATQDPREVVPDLTPLTRSPAPAFLAAKANLQRIAQAIHTYHDVYARLPPSVLRGPDGKLWHSWRVLILPYLGQQSLYDQYKLDEPWDGPNNLKLLVRMPDVYRDPVFGQPATAQERGYSHYAVVAGEGCAFTAEGVQFTSPFAIFPGQGERISLGNLKDGTSFTTLVGVVGPQARIPWTKPQDLELTAELPALGEPGSFATPFELGGQPAAGIVCFDTAAHLVPRDVSPQVLRKLITVADGQFVSDEELPGILSGGPKPRWTLAVQSADSGIAARLDCELVSTLASPSVGQTVSGRFTLSGQPLSGVAIIFQSERTTKRVSLAKDGSYSTALPPDKYRVTLSADPPGSRFSLDPKYLLPDRTPLSVVVRGGENKCSFDLN